MMSFPDVPLLVIMRLYGPWVTFGQDISNKDAASYSIIDGFSNVCVFGGFL